jgi:hypothetical protein
MPTQSPLVLLWFMLLVAWLTVAITNADVHRLHRHGLAVCIAAAVLSVAYAATHVVLGLGKLSVPSRAMAVERPLVTGTYSPESGPSGEFRWTRDEAHFYWPVTDRYVLLKLGVQHPDVVQQPVQLTIATACGTALSLPVNSTDPITVGLEVPDGQKMAHWAIKVSRTFQPSAFGGDDTRRLGATVATGFTGSADVFRRQQHTLTLPGAGCENPTR